METIFTSLIQSNIEPAKFVEIDLSNTDISEIVDHIPKNKIRHLVLSGGGMWGFSMYGILSEAVKYGFIEKSNIKTIYCTSVGSIIAVLFSLNYEERVIQDYLVKRPWKTVFKRRSTNVFQIYETYGLFTINIFEDLFEPLFTALDMNIGLTLLDLYEYSGVEIHIYATELNEYKLVDMSYKTHPHWRVCDAVYASCTVPILFSPIIDDTSCYLDGGLLMNYPVRQLIENLSEIDSLNRLVDGGRDGCGDCNGPPIDEIFGIHIIEKSGCISITRNILITIEQFLFCIFYKIIAYFGSFQTKTDILYEINIVKHASLMSFTYNTLLLAEYRENVINQGKQLFRENAKKWWENKPVLNHDIATASASASVDDDDDHSNNNLFDNEGCGDLKMEEPLQTNSEIV